MSTSTTTPTRPRPGTDASTRTLLRAGLIAGPIFMLTATVQVLVRDGFDLARHPISLLAVGPGGWVQIANFILAGLLGIAFAVGVARAVPTGASSRWAPILLGLFGVGLVIGGAFPADGAFGFPAGAPDGIPATTSFHAKVHAVAPPLAFLSLIAACFVVARRLGRDGHRAAAAWTRALAIVCFVLSVPFGPGASVRLFVAIGLAFAWQVWFAWRLLTERRAA
ncbi:hypothetical protein GCM10009819_32190 [Agromyces tropicus]|uniref:DUF998 domain-containing protein n=1 Tax=Agromyces tropicus TaxID=555371 RepID=A0ABP5GB21_9MICO